MTTPRIQPIGYSTLPEAPSLWRRVVPRIALVLSSLVLGWSGLVWVLTWRLQAWKSTQPRDWLFTVMLYVGFAHAIAVVGAMAAMLLIAVGLAACRPKRTTLAAAGILALAMLPYGFYILLWVASLVWF
jgi:hypothetical protein